MSLTAKQQRVYDYVCEYIGDNGYSPTYQEIQDFFTFKSIGSVVDYVNYLKKAGYLRTGSANSARSLELVEQSEENALIPILGTVAAGFPIDLLRDRDYGESLSVPISFLSKGECYALQVQGDSMIEDGIFEGDFVVIRSKKTAGVGETVVALVNGAATIKKYYKKGSTVELHPANERLKPIIVDKGKDFEIQGVLVALMRKY